MRHVFIINPAAGRTDRSRELIEQAGAVMRREGLPYTCHVTGGPGDATLLAREEAQRGDPLRVYACGGDGTLNETLCGLVGFPNAALSQIPIGSGNDFIKIFGSGARDFTPDGLLDACESVMDLIDCNGRYAINICSVGLDARIGWNMRDFKRLPFVSGRATYLLSLGVNFVRGIHEPYEVAVDGQLFQGSFTLLCACNGQFYGGGFHAAPEAVPDDGLLEFRVVKGLSRLTVAGVVGKYAKGLARELPQYVTCLRGREMRVRCDKENPVNIDGEVIHTAELYFRVAGEKIRIFYPRAACYK